MIKVRQYPMPDTGASRLARRGSRATSASQWQTTIQQKSIHPPLEIPDRLISLP
jgi:hypothetical protein